MKKETKELIKCLRIALIEDANDNDGYSWLNCKGSDYLNQKTDWADRIMQGEYKDNICQNLESNFNRLFALFDKFEETEKLLGMGGLVKDSKGNWCKHGDKVKYTTTKDVDGTGTLDFDLSGLAWFLTSDDGENFYLGNDYDEIYSFEKV